MPGPTPMPPSSPSAVHPLEGWSLQDHEVVTSTQDLAAGSGVWTAVRARRQTGGRGRFDRVWVSDAGGLWLSAVVPWSQRIPGWEALPLAAGWGVVDTVRACGVGGLRLRWPNDVLVGERKLAGLLVDRPGPERAVIGLGLNVTNDPAVQNNALKCCATRLADGVAGPPPDLDALTAAVLRRWREVVEELTEGGFAAVAERVNGCWRQPSRVALELAEGQVTGWFLGVTGEGALRLRAEGGVEATYRAHQVRHLQELEQA